MKAFVIALALSLTLLGSSASGAQTRGKATLKLTGGAPLTVRGTQFAPAERVRVAVVGEGLVRRVTASGQGVFVVRFANMSYDRCNGLIVLAVGSDGSRAVLKRPELYCPPRL
jgi:hypothetical protein